MESASFVHKNRRLSDERKGLPAPDGTPHDGEPVTACSNEISSVP